MGRRIFILIFQVAEISSRLQFVEAESVAKHKLHLADNRIRELEAKYELEISIRQRVEVHRCSFL